MTRVFHAAAGAIILTAAWLGFNRPPAKATAYDAPAHLIAVMQQPGLTYTGRRDLVQDEKILSFSQVGCPAGTGDLRALGDTHVPRCARHHRCGVKAAGLYQRRRGCGRRRNGGDHAAVELAAAVRLSKVEARRALDVHHPGGAVAAGLSAPGHRLGAPDARVTAERALSLAPPSRECRPGRGCKGR